MEKEVKAVISVKGKVGQYSAQACDCPDCKKYQPQEGKWTFDLWLCMPGDDGEVRETIVPHPSGRPFYDAREKAEESLLESGAILTASLSEVLLSKGIESETVFND